MIVGLKGDRVRLVPPERAAHLENALAWMNDPEVTKTLEFHLGVSRKAEEAFFDRVEASRADWLSWAILDEADRHIGIIDLRLAWPHRLGVGGLFLGDPSSWGKGYATEAVRLRSRFAFEELGIHRVEGHTICPAMRRVYEKCGYRHEGTWREKLWRGGRWHDAEFFAILESDYAKIAETSRSIPGRTAEATRSPMPNSPE